MCFLPFPVNAHIFRINYVALSNKVFRIRVLFTNEHDYFLIILIVLDLINIFTLFIVF